MELDKAEVTKQGKDLTIVSYGAQMRVVDEAVREYEKANEGVAIEVIDLQTVYPFDLETVAKSVKRTGRCIVTHEAQISGGIAGEVAAALQKECFLHLEAPIARVCGFDTPFPLKLEPFYLPNKLKLAEAIAETLNY